MRGLCVPFKVLDGEPAEKVCGDSSARQLFPDELVDDLAVHRFARPAPPSTAFITRPMSLAEEAPVSVIAVGHRAFDFGRIDRRAADSPRASRSRRFRVSTRSSRPQPSELVDGIAALLDQSTASTCWPSLSSRSRPFSTSRVHQRRLGHPQCGEPDLFARLHRGRHVVGETFIGQCHRVISLSSCRQPVPARRRSLVAARRSRA